MAFRSSTPSDLRGRCKRCYLLDTFCICETIPVIETPFRLLIVRHGKERWSTTNTARIAGLALARSKIVDYGIPDQPRFDESAIDPQAWVLFPSAPEESRELPTKPPPQVIVPDGSWRQARHILRRVKRLGELPRLSLPPPRTPVRRLRRARAPYQMSTLEAIARVVEILSSEDDARLLDELHDRMVTASFRGRGIQT